MDLVYLFICIIFLGFFFNKKVSSNETWRATITPLASIIGSGFLIAAPILNSLNSKYSYLLMLGLCCATYCIGIIIRWNIQNVEENSSSYISEKLSDIFLSIAYILSVSYYLYLLSSFILKATSLHGLDLERGLTTLIVCSIAYYGHQHGFKSLEKVESISVNIKLSIIFTFLVSLIVFNIQNDSPVAQEKAFDFDVIRVLLGLVIMVQGFETSRYLGSSYSSKIRVTSMRNAQLISTGIYLLFIILFSSVFILYPLSGAIEETSVIDAAKHVFRVAPVLILLAALSSQLSAALADMSGCGGLIGEFSKGKISERNSYILIAILILVIIWSFNIFEVISLASKGFALYYLLQCISSAKYYFRRSLSRLSFSLFVGLFCLAVVILGLPFE
ncbi:putative membrane protein [Halobacteriovorax marinus SJ]|uniref:Membrane protein n=1 Tax=Halobacteriovorax marinus (strain ATCC BAA-682 / DSM 15412 / SJ) TaxID=862908 RepID=E1WY38_HALMS|nr:hypothetical protein [Halobacteriovorax marinus]CBW27593.1 putative membrane protein [Halobacteriovorax marinus SJ]